MNGDEQLSTPGSAGRVACRDLFGGRSRDWVGYADYCAGVGSEADPNAASSAARTSADHSSDST